VSELGKREPQMALTEVGMDDGSIVFVLERRKLCRDAALKKSVESLPDPVGMPSLDIRIPISGLERPLQLFVEKGFVRRPRPATYARHCRAYHCACIVEGYAPVLGDGIWNPKALQCVQNLGHLLQDAFLFLERHAAKGFVHRGSGHPFLEDPALGRMGCSTPSIHRGNNAWFKAAESRGSKGNHGHLILHAGV